MLAFSTSTQTKTYMFCRRVMYVCNFFKQIQVQTVFYPKPVLTLYDRRKMLQKYCVYTYWSAMRRICDNYICIVFASINLVWLLCKIGTKRYEKTLLLYIAPIQDPRIPVYFQVTTSQTTDNNFSTSNGLTKKIFNYLSSLINLLRIDRNTFLLLLLLTIICYLLLQFQIFLIIQCINTLKLTKRFDRCDINCLTNSNMFKFLILNSRNDSNFD